MPPRTKTSPKAAPLAPVTSDFVEWDALVAESHVDTKPFLLRVPKPEEDGSVSYEFLTIPVPSGAAYINLNAAQQRVDVAGILVNLTTSSGDEEQDRELFTRLMTLMGKADFPIVDNLASKVLEHYFNAPPKAADGSAGGPGESSAS